MNYYGLQKKIREQKFCEYKIKRKFSFLIYRNKNILKLLNETSLFARRPNVDYFNYIGYAETIYEFNPNHLVSFRNILKPNTTNKIRMEPKRLNHLPNIINFGYLHHDDYNELKLLTRGCYLYYFRNYSFRKLNDFHFYNISFCRDKIILSVSDYIKKEASEFKTTSLKEAVTSFRSYLRG